MCVEKARCHLPCGASGGFLAQFTQALAVSAFGAVALGCNDQPTEPVPPDITSASALPVAGVPGWQLADTARVRVIDGAGNPVAGVDVTWEVRVGGGSVEVLGATSDADGLSAAVWTRGAATGANQLRATIAGADPVDFVVEGTAFRADRLAADGIMGCGRASGALWCWGPGFWANTAPPSVAPPRPPDSPVIDPDLSPGLVDASHGFVDLAVAGPVVCGLDPQQAIWCTTGPDHAFVEVAGLPPARQVIGTLESYHSPNSYSRFCALAASDSTAWCWRTDAVPSQIAGSPAFASLYASRGDRYSAITVLYDEYRACGLLVDSTAVCWGVGPPGDGSISGALDHLVAVSGGNHFAELMVGDRFSCGRESGGAVLCWGGKDFEALTLELVPTGATLLAVYFDRAQAVRISAATASCLGAVAPAMPPPTGIPSPGIAAFAYNSQTCARLPDGQVYCSSEFDNGAGPLYGYTFYYPVQPVREIPLTTQRRIIVDRKAE